MPHSTGGISMEVGLIGRQPILNNDGSTFGYELLYRSDNNNRAEVLDDNMATSSVLISAMNTFGLDKLIGNKRAFINVGVDLLLDPILEALPKERFVLEILEDVKIEEKTLNRIKELKEHGYTIAVDDLNFEEELVENFKPVFEFAEVLKFDIMQTGIENLTQKIKPFKQYNLKFLAEKVENINEFEACKSAGFSYYQGYFFSKPDVISGKKLDPSKLSVVNIVSLLNSDCDIAKIEREFLRAPELAFNLLKYLNSASIGARSKITSISHAISLLGRSQLAQWLTLYLYADTKENKFSTPLMESAIFRAKFMSELGHTLNMDKKMQEKAYLTGMVSLIDALMGTTFDDVFNEISFDDDIKEAITKKSGKLGKLFLASLIAEKSNPKMIEVFKKIGLDEAKLGNMMHNCYNWLSENKIHS